MDRTLDRTASTQSAVDYSQVVLERRLRDALAELNPGLPAEALE